MYNIRFHGRGGQGIKTSSRLLGTAFFIQGYEVQDAPRYGAERRGAPMNAYVRADVQPINARGVIRNPDLVIVADDSLVPIPAAGVLDGINDNTVLLIVSRESEQTWRTRLNFSGPILILPPTENKTGSHIPLNSAACAGAAACLTGVITRNNLLTAIRDELEEMGPELVQKNQDAALYGFERMSRYLGLVKQSQPATLPDYRKPSWIDLPLETSRLSAPTIHGAQTSVMVRTGLWRTQRPVIDYEQCHKCWWVCSSFCPDSVINIRKDGAPVIDYDHCKGCMICVAQCPSHAIETIPEAEAIKMERQEQTA